MTCLALFFAFNVYWFHAAWEIAYRHHGAAVLRAQIEALPIYNTDRPARFTDVGRESSLLERGAESPLPCA